MQDHRFDTKCPNCGTAHTGALNTTSDGQPSDGDFTVCIECAQPAVFEAAADGGLRLPTADELLEIEAMPGFRAARAAVHHVKGARRAGRQ